MLNVKQWASNCLTPQTPLHLDQDTQNTQRNTSTPDVKISSATPSFLPWHPYITAFVLPLLPCFDLSLILYQLYIRHPLEVNTPLSHYFQQLSHMVPLVQSHCIIFGKIIPNRIICWYLSVKCWVIIHEMFFGFCVCVCVSIFPTLTECSKSYFIIAVIKPPKIDFTGLTVSILLLVNTLQTYWDRG